jgi:glyceraldehyde-3-phosphate dehydrogenase/erythrose-4-phosphate dehydrogenase
LRSFCEAQHSAAAAAAAAATFVLNRSALVNLAPTSTGSATAIALIFPELKGKLNGLAVRVPLTNSSITDCVFEVRLYLVSHCEVVLHISLLPCIGCWQCACHSPTAASRLRV